MNIQGKIGPQYSAIQEISVHTDTREHPRACQAQRDPARIAGLVRLRHRCASCRGPCPWKEIVTYIEDPVVREQMRCDFQAERIGAPPYGLNGDLGLRYQSVGWTHPAPRTVSGKSSRRAMSIATSP